MLWKNKLSLSSRRPIIAIGVTYNNQSGEQPGVRQAVIIVGQVR